MFTNDVFPLRTRLSNLDVENKCCEDSVTYIHRVSERSYVLGVLIVEFQMSQRLPFCPPICHSVSCLRPFISAVC